MSNPTVRVNLPPKVPGGAPPPTPSAAGRSATTNRPAFKVALSWQDWVMRLVLVAVIGLAGVGVFYSYQRLAQVQERGRKLDATVSQLNNDVQILEGKYTQADVDQLMARSKEAQALLFAGEDALHQWLTELKIGLVPLALTATANFGQALTNRAPGQNLSVVPATVELAVETAAGAEPRRSPYQRVMDLMHGLSQQPKRVDVVGLEAQSGTNSIAEAKVVLELWAGEENQQ